MRPEQIPHLNFVRDLFGNLWLDVRDSSYLPVLGAETNHDKSTLALIFNPKIVKITERLDKLNPYRIYDGPSQPTTPAFEQVRQFIAQMELENAELRYALNQATKDTTGDRAKRHLERYRSKLQKANDAGDLMAAAAADQRVRALEDLLSP